MKKRTAEEIAQDKMSGSKVCSHCKIRQDFSEYIKTPSGAGDGYSYTCRTCRNSRRRKKVEPNYSRTPEELAYDIESGSKVCGKCKERRVFKHFPSAKGGADGYDCTCYSCLPKRHRQYHHVTRYGITVEEYKAMVDKSDNTCYICGKPEKNGKSLAIDHCHTSGKVRGLLCRACNTAIGILEDDVNRMKSAIEYLEEA